MGELTPELAHMVMDGSLSLGEAQQIAVSTPHDTALREADSQKRWRQPLRRRRAQKKIKKILCHPGNITKLLRLLYIRYQLDHHRLLIGFELLRLQ